QSVTLRSTDKTQGGQEEVVPCRTVLWAAGVQASPLGRVIHERTGAELDRAGRVKVEPDLSGPGPPSRVGWGDVAAFAHGLERPLPGWAPVAMQQGHYVAKLIRARLEKRPIQPFRYIDRGTMATIGRAAAVAQIGRLRLSGLI